MSFGEVSRNDVCVSLQTPHDPTSISKEDFTEILIGYFKPYVNDYANGNLAEDVEFMWQSSEDFSPYFVRKELAGIYIEVIFSLFEVLRCTDYDVIRNVLENFALRRLQIAGYFCSDIHVQSPLSRLPLTPVYYYLGPLRDEQFSMDSFYYPFLFLNLETIQRMLRYGVPFYMKDHCQIYYMPIILNSIKGRTFATIDLSECQFEENELIDLYRMNPRRMNIVLLGLHVFCLKKDYKFLTRHQNYIKSLQLVFKTITEPFITLSEISTFLNKYVTLENKEQKVTEYCDTFAEDFPESRNPLQPRTLQHLCRCKVRECLKKAGKLPHGVWDLTVSKRIKNYILIQNYEEEYHPEYVSALSINK